MTNLAHGLPWPLWVIDFEASGLGPGSYPIEAGIALWRAPGEAVRVWSSLISPAPDWIEGGLWDVEAEKVHQLPQSALSGGLTVKEAAHGLNALAAHAAVFSDAPQYDDYWLRRLYAAAGLQAAFRLEPLDALLSRVGEAGQGRFQRWQEKAAPRHRAGDDAERHMKGIGRALKIGVSAVRHDLADLVGPDTA